MIRCQLNTKVWSDFYRVLIADDSVPSRSMLARLVQSKCSHCDEAEDGLKAIEMVKASLEYGKPYDIILMDSEMPNINGPEAVRYIKTQLGYTGIVIGVTGNRIPEDISNFKSLSADDVLTNYHELIIFYVEDSKV